MGTFGTESCEGCLYIQFKHLPPQLALKLNPVRLTVSMSSELRLVHDAILYFQTSSEYLMKRMKRKYRPLCPSIKFSRIRYLTRLSKLLSSKNSVRNWLSYPILLLNSNYFDNYFTNLVLLH